MLESVRRTLTGIAEQIAGLLHPSPVLTPQPVPIPSGEPSRRAR
jgi:hypothetical protein